MPDFRPFILLAACILFCDLSIAQTVSPAGVWKSIDDHSGKPRALIRISESNGTWQGKIEKLFPAPGEDLQPLCIKCTGALKDQPVVGMTILSGMKAEDGGYSGGTILDPENGKTYQSKMTLSDDGKMLQVRGYIGVPMLGRTQTWHRSE